MKLPTFELSGPTPSERPEPSQPPSTTSRRDWIVRAALGVIGAAPMGEAWSQDAAPSPLSRPASGASTAPPATAVDRRPLEFPRDFGSHPEHQTEWWYLTGWLETDDSAKRSFGFQVTFFRSRTGVAATDSRFSAQQLVFAHAALSDLEGGKQRHDQRIARAGFGVDAALPDTDVALRDWQLKRSGTAGRSHYDTRVQSDAGGFAFNFSLDATQPTLLQGEAGYSRKGATPGQASRYYSEPQLGLHGTLRLDGKSMLVTGKGWLDHEWSDSYVGSDAVGWDWTGMNLDDGSALTAFRLRRRDGTTTYAGGSFRHAGGAVRNFGPDEVIFTPGRRWKSTTSNADYPVEWVLQTPVGRFEIAALLDAQEQDSRASTGAFYWEGLSELRAVDGGGGGGAGRSARRVGRGYLEMTGYAERLTL